ncbi:MAG: radical SAM family heme chaperone HemW [Flammeovirgaceae bacterium]
MAGLYFHIPFCKQACHYCDFHFSTNRTLVNEMVNALAKEMALQKSYLGGEALETIYFGGGTPSLLSKNDVEQLVEMARNMFPVDNNVEITFEANPDDLTLKKLEELKSAGINRLSIGIQSFNDTVLKFFNRAHTVAQAEASVRNAQVTGFNNISVDLIYGIPGQTLDELKNDVSKFLQLNPQHISAYALTIEKNTVFGHRLKNGEFSTISEDSSAEQFEYLMKEFNLAGYGQYEISNFCKPGFQSKHNTSYWQQKKYLGVGPSAHSYDGNSRQWNVSNNHLYLKSLLNDRVPFEREVLTHSNQINEYFFTTLRTSWGTDLKYLKTRFGFVPHLPKIDVMQQQGLIVVENEVISLTQKGKLLADKIALEFFID